MVYKTFLTWKKWEKQFLHILIRHRLRPVRKPDMTFIVHQRKQHNLQLFLHGVNNAFLQSMSPVAEP